VPLKSLRASESTVAFVRDEAFELVNLNAVCDPPDPDTVDQVVSVFDADTGYGASPNTGIAVTLELNGAFLAPTVVASGDLTAFLESELGQCGLDNDGDGFSNSNFLRVFDTQTNDLTLGRYDDVAVAPLVNDRSLAISGSKVFFRTPGGFLDFESDGNAGVDGLAGRTDIAVSPDGKNVYVTGANDNAIAVFGRDDIAGTLTFVEAKFDGIAGVDGLAGAGSVSISPDGNSLYVTSVGDDAVAVFDRDPLTGALSFVEAELGGDPYPFFPLLNPKATVVSPDGMHVYVANQFIDREIQIFDRSSFTGELILGFLAYAGLPDLHDVDGLAISADGQNVYAISSQQNALAVLARESFYGGLTLLQTLFDGVGGVDGLDLPSDIIVSPDGGHVYVTSYSDDAVAIFRRDPSTGLLEYVGIENSDTAGVAGLNLAVGIAMSPDGTRVYVATRGDNRGALVFQRNKATGELAFVEGRFNGIGMEGTPLASPDDVVVSPDDAHVYVSGFNDVTALGNDRRLAVFDTAASPSPSLLSAQPAAMHVAVADERAAILTREAVAPADGASACGPTSPPGGCDLNGDGDAADSVAQLYDATVSPPDLINLGVAASRVSISSALVALTVREADEEGATGLSCDGIPIPPGGCDANGDGDPFDDVLAVFEIGKAPPPFNVRVAADAIGADGSMVAFITPEAGENQSSAGGIHCSKTTSPPGGCDLNADGDAADRILRIYDGTRRKIIETGQSAEDFVIGDGFVAFRTNEAAQGPNSLGCEPTVPPGGCSLNGDGLADEHVMQIYDLESGELINTGYAAIPCELPGCEPGAPYKIRKQGDITTVSFLTDELEQAPAGETNGCMSTTPPGGCDLNGDGDGDDIVLTVFSIASRRAQTAGTVIDDATISPVPDDSSTLPTDDVGGGTVVYVEAKESDLDQDVNADGLITDDMVVVIAGDFDEDGSFDDFDTCVATDNRDQLDIDGDGLGDTACDPDPRACPPAPLAGCRLTTLPGKSALTIKDSADDTRDMLKWKWTRGVATTLADLGNPVGGVAAYSTCVYDASVSSQPLLGAAVFPGGDCAGKPCWKSAGKKGYKFKDKAGAQAGITRVKIKAGEDGKAKVLVKGRGSGLADAGLGGAGPPFAPPVTVQLIVNAGARTDCWQADYSTFKQNDSDRFKARSD
jgi:DNA-binding beta-propeller fold protein YncE